MSFARHTFMLQQPVDGAPLIEHLHAAWRHTGEQPDELANAPELPAACATLWTDFTELHGCRGSNGFAASRITYADIDAYQRVRGIQLEQWEIDAIREVDLMWLNEFASKPKKDGERD